MSPLDARLPGLGPGEAAKFVRDGATFSDDRAYRYLLWRRWGAGPWLMVIGLNPSTADETADDPTIRRCLGYARRWRFGGLLMANLFAYRATDPKDLLRAASPIGPANLQAVREHARTVVGGGGGVLAAWGAHGDAFGVARALTDILEGDGIPVACLGRTKAGQPRHPLYLPSDARPEPYLLDGGRLCAGPEVAR